MTADFLYLILPTGNAVSNGSLDDEMRRRGVGAEFSDLQDGARIYRVPAADLRLLPSDEKGPYFGDSNGGHSFSTLCGELFEDERTKRGGTAWTPVLVEELKRPERKDVEAAIDEFFSKEYPEEQPSYRLEPDGDTGWAFWVLPDDATSYVRQDLSIQWLGTDWEPGEESRDEPPPAPTTSTRRARP